MRPATEGTKAQLAGTGLPPVAAVVEPVEGCETTGFSFEYTTFTPVSPRFLHSCRMTRARGQTEVCEISATSKRVGSSLLPAPMLQIIGVPAAFACVMSSSFAVTVSTASTT